MISFDEAKQATPGKVKEWYKHLNPGLVSLLGLIGFDKVYSRAEGIYVWDREGNRYLDFLGGYGSLNLGHNHPQVIKAIEEVDGLPNILQASLNPFASALAKNLSEITPGNLFNSFFCNSGAEAVEGAIKTARAATGKTWVVAAEHAFHGKTLGALSVTGREKYRKPFAPLVPHCEWVPFGDLVSLESRLKKKDVAAFIVEPIQGEGGIILPPDKYLKGVEEICRKYETLLILDEIQTGLGRTGKMFAAEHWGVKPDIMTLAKSLGGGVMPIGAFIATSEVWEKAYGGINKCLYHTSTFGGNTRACAAAIATLEVINEENLVEQARGKGDYLLNELKKLETKHEMIKEIRGKGLMVGVEFYEPAKGWLNKIGGDMFKKLSHEYLASMVAGQLLDEHKIITAYTLNNPNVIRLEPPLTVTFEQLDWVVKAFDEICEKYSGFLKLTFKTGKSIAAKIFKRSR